MAQTTMTEEAAAYLHREADRLVAVWIEWVRSRLGTSTIENLPYRAIENHIPPVIRVLGEYVRNPVEAISSELIGHLRMHGQIRRDQGYSSAEIIGEFDGLSAIVMNSVRSELAERISAASGDEAAGLFMRLATGLRLIHGVVLETYSETNAMKGRAVAERLEQFSTAISHDLKNPLSAIKLGLDALRRKVGEGDAFSREFDSLVVELDRTFAMLDTLRLISVTESAWAGDRLVLLSDALSRLVGEYSDLADRKGVSVRVEDGLPAVKAEAIVVYIALSNLLTNAIKYSDPDKAERWIAVSAELIPQENDTGFVQVEIRDNGIGIPPDLLPRVRQRGFRAHPGFSYGTGMGLYLVHSTVEERGGEFEIESREGEGTVVRVRFRCISERTGNLLPDRIDTITLIRRNVEPGRGPDDAPL